MQSVLRDVALLEAQIRQSVLFTLLTVFPQQLTVDELIRELAPEGTSAEQDDVRNAAAFLVGAGLAHRQGTFLIPSRTAHVANELLHA